MDYEVGEKTSEQSKVISYFELAATFLHIGFISYSLAALGEAKKILVAKKNWLTDDEYLSGVGLSQLLPGAPTVNLFTYAGYLLRGFPGALVSSVFFVFPCFVAMVVLAHLYLNYHNVSIMSSLFKGIGALVVGLVLNTIIDLWKSGVDNLQLTTLAVAGFIMVFFLHFSIVTIILVAGTASLIFAFLTAKSNWWKAFMGKAFWRSQKSEQKPVQATRFVFSRKKYLSMLVMLLALLLLNFIVNFSNPTFQKLGNTLFQIGGLTFGSGYAMLPFIQDTMVNQFQWVTQKEFGVALALSLITPGPVTIISAFVGYKVAGILGATLAMINMYFPSFVVVNIITDIYNRARRAENIKLVVKGIVAVFIGTLWVVIIKLTGSSLMDIPTYALALAAFGVRRFSKIDTVWIVLGGAALSIFLF